MAQVKDMTKGSTTKHIVLFALPLLLGNLFQQFYNMVDAIVVGRYVGNNALGAVGACGSINFLFFALSSGLGGGIGVMVAQYFGAGDEEKVRKTIGNSVYVIVTMALLVSIIGVVWAPDILKLLETPEVLIKDSTTYLRMTCGALIVVAAYNGVSSILRALGDSKTPLVFLVLGSIINIVFDLVFVLYMDMEVFGVALATVISQCFTACTCFIYAICKVPYFKLTREEMKLEPSLIKNAVKIGVPFSLQNSLIAISCIILQRVVNSFGPVVVGAFTVTSRIEQLVQQPFSSLGLALTTYSGQNVGAGRIDRVKKGMRSATLMALLFSLSMLPLAYLCGESIIRIFVKKDEYTVIEMGVQALKITSLCYFPLGMIYVPRALLNGAGDAGFAMINGISEVICRILFSTVLTRIAIIGYWGIWITSGATWTVTAIVCMIRYFSGVWMRKGLAQAPSGAKTTDLKG
ncbi:MAG: MATE family efflux transporter [Clostridium sp.]|nr:MATE family efflux transporter [Clostridium sp.]